MFDLRLNNAELNDSTAQVSWCVDQETLKLLSDLQIVDPQVVIVVALEGRHYHSFKEYRKVVSMKDLMAWVELRVAGPNKIWGFISLDSASDTKDKYLSRSNGDFKTDILNRGGDKYVDDLDPSVHNLTVSAPQPIVVPTGVFASEPWQWEQTWVNWLFREKPIDQCDFRRRRMFAYTIQPILVLLSLIVRFAFFLLGLLIGAKNLSFEYLLNPLSTKLEDANEVVMGGSIFIRSTPEDDIYTASWQPTPLQMLSYLIRKYYTLPFMPVFLIPIALATYFHTWGFLLVLAGLTGAIFVVLMIFAGFMSHYFSDTVDKFLLFVGLKSDEPWYLNQEDIDLLTCDASKKPLNFKTLPARKKTLYLRFQNLKSKVCKPYSA